MIVELTEYEMNFCRILASLREIANAGKAVKDAKMGAGNGWQYNFDGVMTEYAFCKARNIFFDCSVEPRSGGYDCITNKGVRIDIKSTRHKGRGIAIPLKKKTDVDLFVVCYIEGNRVDYYGYCTAEAIYKPENIKNYGKGECYSLPLESLSKI
jgi:hypothetical protein